jgi:hypothetical protein
MQDSTVNTVTSLWAGHSEVRISVGVRCLCLLQDAQTGYGADAPFYSRATRGSFPWGWVGRSGQGLRLSLPLVPRLSMSGAIPQLPLSAFMECIHVTGTQNACKPPAYLGQLLSMQKINK